MATYDIRLGIPLASGTSKPELNGEYMGRVLIGVVIGIVLVIWLLASCVGAIF